MKINKIKYIKSKEVYVLADSDYNGEEKLLFFIIVSHPYGRLFCNEDSKFGLTSPFVGK